MYLGYVCYSLSGVGPRVRARNLIEGIATRTHHDVTLVTNEKSVPRGNIDVRKIPTKLSLLNPLTLRRVRHALQDTDVVHVPVNFYQFIYTKLAYNGPIVAGAGIQHGAVFRRVMNQLSVCKMIETHKEVAELWAKSGVDSTYIYPAVDRTKFYPYDDEEISKQKEKFGIDSNSKTVLFVGKLNEFKGAHIIESVASALREAGVFTVVAGDGPMRDRFVSNPDVIFRGFVENDRLPKLYNIADVTVVPSQRESFSIVSLESAACGTPVVTTTAYDCVMARIFRDRETYVWTEERTPHAVLEAILLLLNEDDRYATQVDRGFSAIYELGLTLDETISRYLDVYQQCAEIDA